MKGLHLRSLTGELLKVDSTFEAQPVNSISGVDQKLNLDGFIFEKDYYQLPLKALRNFSFEEICKLKYSSGTTMDQSVVKLFEDRPNYEVVRKVMSSMWRWGMGKGTWNEVVDIYNGIRHFSLDLDPNFEIRLDYTTWYNEFGHARYSRTYIDGVFAFLVYYKHVHVMTIGFSFMENRRILVQQVQLKEKTGNRWLYRFPQNRLEFVIALFAKHFPNFALYVIDGGALAKKTIANYQSGLQRAQERTERNRRSLENDSTYCGADIKEDENEVVAFQTKIAHLKHDKTRLTKFYSDCGGYVLDEPLMVNHILHHKILLPSV